MTVFSVHIRIRTFRLARPRSRAGPKRVLKHARDTWLNWWLSVKQVNVVRERDESASVPSVGMKWNTALRCNLFFEMEYIAPYGDDIPEITPTALEALRSTELTTTKPGGLDVKVFVIRHGETEWSLSGQHTGTTDVPLTDNGRRQAERMRPILARQTFSLILVSPLQRARETCGLAGLGEGAIIEPSLMEWNYGEYEGLTPQQIREERPDWLIFRDGCPGGETPRQVATRVDQVVARARAAGGDVALFAHGHVLRVLGARWIGLPPRAGQHFLLNTGTLSVLAYYHEIPAVRIWNGHIADQPPKELRPRSP